ncbi:neuronal acetylcholine receptor subunit alpha-7-like isoform X1 [Seriola lalandi dorsalis]|uniref:Neuronal acetylcholine receptor subunit alpha-7 n=2 Tax=Seriola lalandi dorsalis TaxID=1841481 RepID=A0A3B4W8N0_SERLL|nr:neuronal acetylcholine receptor subunit alpha-7-like isoform X1 [Seriola lalandi dorsalis]XP_056220736.1 neuronal acetylcholine receptor subunit alpha-7-like [Seriola aureovittata]
MDFLHVLLFVAVTACTVEVSLQGVYQHRLYKELMSGYNPLVRPVSDDSNKLTVDFGLSLMQIIDVDEKNQILTTNIWLKLYWNDHYLQWNESEYPGVPNVRFPDNFIWKPDILLYNSADERFDGTFRTNILVNSTGACSYIPPGIFKTTCYIDVRWFPFDVQRCDLKFGSWTYGGFSLDLRMVEADISGYIANGEWDLVEVQGRRNERFYACCEEPYPDVTFTVVMRRRTLYYGLNLLIPCVLISTLALLVFLLPADSGEKISLGITVLLSLTVFMLLVAEIMPATSDSVPLIAQYFATTMVIVGLSVIATVLVLQYHHHDPDGSKMPKWTRVILLNWCAWFLRMKRPGEERVRSACHNKAPRSSVTSIDVSAGASAPPPTNGNVLYVGMRSLESIHYSTAATSSDSGAACGRLAGQEGEDEMLLPAGQTPFMKSLEPELVKILDEVRYIAKRFRYQDEHESVCNEWKFAASVIDRLCLMAFSLITILCTIGILMSAPNFVEAISKDFFT